jgi:hypothetical protein
MQQFTVRSSNFPFQNSVGGLYLNAVKKHEMAVKIADIEKEKWLPDGKKLIELSMSIPELRQARQLGKKFISLITNKDEKNTRIRSSYLNKLLDLGCIDREDIKKYYHEDNLNGNDYFEKTVMKVVFDFNGSKKTYSNLTMSKMFYYPELDMIIEFMLFELFVYNAKMSFLVSDMEGFEFCKMLKYIEVATPEENQEMMIDRCINERLYKRITKKIGIDVNMDEFQKNFNSYKTIHDMWKV